MWVMFILVVAGGGTAMEKQEFSNKDACLIAADTLVQTFNQEISLGFGSSQVATATCVWVGK